MDIMDPALVITDLGRHYLKLQSAPELGPIRLARLLEQLGGVEAVLGASQARLEEVEGVGPKVARSVFEARNYRLEREIETAAACGVRIRCLEDEDYPAALRHITDPPTCLYLRGTLEPTDAVAIAIVGARRCSYYGREQAQRFGELLGQAGFTVVSGLARGIDSHAHRGALKAGGRTLAVLGNGLGTVYPPEHHALAEEISHHGAVVSELPMECGPEPKNFPGRNRIVVGLTLGVLVVEAGPRSGALISARLGSEYNREVFALPGRIDQPEINSGSNRLIRDGQAKLVTCLEDILDELGAVGDTLRGVGAAASSDHADTSAAKQSAALSADERKVVEVLTVEPIGVDVLATRAGLDASSIAAVLTTLQLKGLVRALPGPAFALRRQTKPVTA